MKRLGSHVKQEKVFGRMCENLPYDVMVIYVKLSCSRTKHMTLVLE
jgi:hypothetical protein